MTRRRVLYLGLFLLLAVFAGLQVNDPDPWLWISLYGTAAALCVLALFGKAPRWPLVVLWLAYFGVAASVFPGFLDWLLHHPFGDLVAEMSDHRPYVEESRELLGLLIAAGCLLALWRWPPAGKA